MFHKVRCNESDSFWVPDECFKGGPLRSEFSFLILFFAFSNLLELIINRGKFLLIEFELGDSAFIVDRDGRLISHGLLNVIYADVLAEDRASVSVVLLNWRSSE